ncbi:CYTH domain-containing protein [Aureibacter tunicatorum]|uniref:CYTH domain-containing protein n=1 Tax=Aureibacter tunicatorum TaxID=866807 RepID=A0AAE3XJP1_9BACT|nr:CYTH domain-containing protein [Aureibacter tunicatorum]MDR6238127.1 CYTH domain-containing protein [Aureibacter tunicatorum]BDD03160.1 CYTH domain-containing protein [Aureibacter tunicatorum]
MGKEIERKFLVNDPTIIKGLPYSFIAQGYLNSDPYRTVRVRIKKDKGFLTIKSKHTEIARAEFEYEIPLADAKQIMDLCEHSIVQKKRYLVEYHGKTWEVDIFEGDNRGLIIAELELEAEKEAFDLPEWVGEEVTSQPKYLNANLAIEPFKNW